LGSATVAVMVARATVTAAVMAAGETATAAVTVAMVVTAAMEVMAMVDKAPAAVLMILAIPLSALAQNAPKVLPVPNDPLELVTGPVQATVTAQDREAALQLLARARDNFALKTGEGAYHLKVAFTADSLGVTSYDGAWRMEEVFDPSQGLRWNASSASGYITARIHSAAGSFSEGTADVIPLRLHEAHGLLNDPLPLPEYAARGSIRTATETFHGSTVVCLLLANTQQPALPSAGRAWEESEECIDPQSALLQMHSEVPGRYVVYDYEQATRFGRHMLPRTVTVTEAGHVVSKISIEGIEEITRADAGHFASTDAMNANGPAITIKGAIRVSRVHRQRPSASMTLHAVCVFGVVTPDGQLVEAHSLQPLDPDSAMAVEDAQSLDFRPSLGPGGAAQHFAFVIEKFIEKQ
jgi:hypothetical protein